ncbi:unnamed protein product [Phytophthora lilii]|uniref:Unnamed protein product n=1 Tax=Phytophthora lilii TaxID=2077276 RepID=A0A9W6XB75_9STRA|nr:unnamed protein product [Phytophthora lilii]
MRQQGIVPFNERHADPQFYDRDKHQLTLTTLSTSSAASSVPSKASSPCSAARASSAVTAPLHAGRGGGATDAENGSLANADSSISSASSGGCEPPASN